MIQCVECGAVETPHKATVRCSSCGHYFTELELEQALQDNNGFERGGAGHNADSGRDQDLGRSSKGKRFPSGSAFALYQDLIKNSESSSSDSDQDDGTWQRSTARQDHRAVERDTQSQQKRGARGKSKKTKKSMEIAEAISPAQSDEDDEDGREYTHQSLATYSETYPAAWVWDYNRLAYRIWSPAEGCWVFQDGSRRQASPPQQKQQARRQSKKTKKSMEVAKADSPVQSNEDDEDAQGYTHQSSATSSETYSGAWVWDSDRLAYRRWSPAEGCWVLQDGSRLPGASPQITHTERARRGSTQRFQTLRAS